MANTARFQVSDAVVGTAVDPDAGEAGAGASGPCGTKSVKPTVSFHITWKRFLIAVWIAGLVAAGRK